MLIDWHYICVLCLFIPLLEDVKAWSNIWQQCQLRHDSWSVSIEPSPHQSRLSSHFTQDSQDMTAPCWLQAALPTRVIRRALPCAKNSRAVSSARVTMAIQACFVKFPSVTASRDCVITDQSVWISLWASCVNVCLVRVISYSLSLASPSVHTFTKASI